MRPSKAPPPPAQGGPDRAVTGVQAAAATLLWVMAFGLGIPYLKRVMRWPPFVTAGMTATSVAAGVPAWLRVPAGAVLLAALASRSPQLVAPFGALATGVLVVVMGPYIATLLIERRLAWQRGLPEPGPFGSPSYAEFAAYFTPTAIFALSSLGLVLYGVTKFAGGDGSEGGAGLALGAGSLFMAIWMGVFAVMSYPGSMPRIGRWLSMRSLRKGRF